MAKTRAQKKAEKRRRQQAQQQRQPGSPERAAESQAQHDTQNPVSGDVAEFEAALETGANTEDYGEHVGPSTGDPHADTQARSAIPGVQPDPVAPGEPVEPKAPAPSRADVGRTDEASTDLETSKPSRADRKAAKQKEKEQRKRERERAIAKQQTEKAEKRRNPIIAFFISCWAELKKVQWPDRDTLVQASAVTLIFVVVMAAYLGGLDAIFNWLIKQIL